MIYISSITAPIIYVLKLESNKYYVGKTTLPVEERFYQHKSGKGAEWTKKFRPLKIVFKQREKTSFSEDTMVKEYMKKYGIDNVRGGSYSQLVLDPGQEEALRREIRHSDGCCLACGLPGHLVKYCPKKKAKMENETIPSKQDRKSATRKDGASPPKKAKVSRKPSSTWKTSRHMADDEDGREVVNQKKRNQSFEYGQRTQGKKSVPRADESQKKMKIDPSIAYTCFSKNHLDGHPLPHHDQSGALCRSGSVNGAGGNPQRQNNACFRCGRQGHMAYTCYARIHLDGHPLPNPDQSDALHPSRTIDCAGGESPQRENNTCFRCGRQGHMAYTCYARNHLDGHPLPSKDKREPK
jgi:predicted GIY-YIG superfamily endonuclease